VEKYHHECSKQVHRENFLVLFGLNNDYVFEMKEDTQNNEGSKH